MTMNLVHRERIPLETADVGAELLDILSRGLYTDPFDAVREYVQNAVDAGAREIIITHTGTALLIRDDGVGMGREELKNARRFGISIKDTTKDIGFRGIGIYSSYGIAGKLRFLSRKPPSNEQLGMEIDFASIKQQLDRSRQTPGRRAAIPLADMLYEHSVFTRQPYAGPIYDLPFTLVVLEDIDPAFREKLANKDMIKDYLLRTVHVKFNEENHGAAVNRMLVQELGIPGVTIKLRYHGHEEAILERRMPIGVDIPKGEFLTNSENDRIAFAWYSLTKGREQIKNGEGGFILKLKSFTLGNKGSLKRLWSREGGGTLHDWHFGEVHILDAAGVVPNAARDGLEPGIPSDLLHAEIQNCFAKLNRVAGEARGYRGAIHRLPGFIQQTDDLKQQANEPNFNPAELYSHAARLKEEISGATNNLTRRTRGRYARPLSNEEREVLAQLQALGKQVQIVENNARKSAQMATNSAIRTSRRKGAGTVSTEREVATPPLKVYLEEVAHTLRNAIGARGQSALDNDLLEIEKAAESELSQRVFLGLDNLVARGIDLPPSVEEARRLLRGRANMEPDGPITLASALTLAGFEPASERETAIIQRLDSALLEASGGRGLNYYRLLETVANHDFESDIPLA